MLSFCFWPCCLPSVVPFFARLTLLSFREIKVVRLKQEVGGKYVVLCVPSEDGGVGLDDGVLTG